MYTENDFCDCVHGDVVKSAREAMLADELVYDAADFFKVFGDSTRIKMLYTLLGREMCVGDLAQTLDMTQSAISHQLKTLRQSGLVKFRKEGKTIFYSLDDDHVTALLKQGLEHVLEKRGGV